MRSLCFFIVIMLFLSGCDKNGNPTNVTNNEAPKIVINEILAINDSNLADEFSENDDWIELYNQSGGDINLAGMYLSDNAENLTKYLIASSAPDTTSIPADGFLLLWADNDADQGVLHLNFKLDGDGEAVYLTESDGITIIDSVKFAEQTPDTSWGRKSDGAGTWINFSLPTPGQSNN